MWAGVWITRIDPCGRLPAPEMRAKAGGPTGVLFRIGESGPHRLPAADLKEN